MLFIALSIACGLTTNHALCEQATPLCLSKNKCRQVYDHPIKIGTNELQDACILGATASHDFKDTPNRLNNIYEACKNEKIYLKTACIEGARLYEALQVEVSNIE